MTAQRISPRKRAKAVAPKMAGGSCLCGEVAFELVREAGRELSCQCPSCRHGAHATHSPNIFIDATKFRWLRGEDQVSNYGPSKDWHLSTSFCRQCGSTLPRVVRSVGIAVVPAGTLDSDPSNRPLRLGFPKGFVLGEGRPRHSAARLLTN